MYLYKCIKIDLGKIDYYLSHLNFETLKILKVNSEFVMMALTWNKVLKKGTKRGKGLY